MKVFGVWMWPGSITTHGAEKTVSNCARAGVTDIFFLVKGLKGQTAFLSSFAPHICGRDLLAELIDAAHRHGIRVHAWFTSACDEHYKQLHPESGRCHYTRGKDRELISLADEGYLAYMQEIVSELCRNYEIDGLHLDYIRYNHLMYGWAEDDLNRYAAEGADLSRLHSLMRHTFLSETEKDPECIFNAYRSGDPSVHALVRARRKDVVHFAETLTAAARQAKKNIPISAALMPEGAYEDIAFSDLHYGQNYEDAARLYDFVLPMAYSKAYKQDGSWVKAVADGTFRRGLKTVMGLHAYDGGTCASLKEDIAALSAAPVEGVCLFREGSFVYAFIASGSLALYNPTSKNITRICAEISCCKHEFETSIVPGEEKSFSLSVGPDDTLRVYSEVEELCLYPASI